jgi:uncharacterized membrane protein
MINHEKVKSMYITKPIKKAGEIIISSIKIIPFLLIFIIQGCWESKIDLIPNELSDDPFNSALNIILSNDKDEDLLLLTRTEKKNEFIMYKPKNSKNKAASIYKFHDITSVWNVFGKKKYIMGVTTHSSETVIYTYYYLIIDQKEATVFGPNQLAEVISLNELITKIKEADESKNLKKEFTKTIEFSNQTHTKLAKSFIDTAYIKKIKLEEEKRKADAKLAKIKSAKGFEICNKSDEIADVAFASLESGVWNSRGWYNVPIGKCTTLAKEIENKTFYYFAIGNKGAKWNGIYGLCFKPKKVFDIKGFNDCEGRGYKTGKYKKVEIANEIWEHKETLSNPKKVASKAVKKIQSGEKSKQTKETELKRSEFLYQIKYYPDQIYEVSKAGISKLQYTSTSDPNVFSYTYTFIRLSRQYSKGGFKVGEVAKKGLFNATSNQAYGSEALAKVNHCSKWFDQGGTVLKRHPESPNLWVLSYTEASCSTPSMNSLWCTKMSCMGWKSAGTATGGYVVVGYERAERVYEPFAK